nr:hypothetical protein [Tanacetum cinerariifolium]
DEDPEEDHVDYPADGGDDGDDEEESSGDEEDDERDSSPPPQIPFPPLPLILSPPSPILAPAPPTSISPPPLQLPSASRKEDRPEDMDEIYIRLDDEQTERQLLAGRLNMLFRNRRAHAYTRLLMEAEARMSREAWTRAT